MIHYGRHFHQTHVHDYNDDYDLHDYDDDYDFHDETPNQNHSQTHLNTTEFAT